MERLKLSGYKSIREAEIEFTRLNVLIGANGAGKSNLVSFFSLLPAALDGKLDGYVGRHGGPNALLHFGAQRTNEIAVSATVRTIEGTGVLHQRLGFRAPDSLFYGDYDRAPGVYFFSRLDTSHLAVVMTTGEARYEVTIYESLRCSVATYHLVDTSLTSRIRTEGYIEENKVHPTEGCAVLSPEGAATYQPRASAAPPWVSGQVNQKP